MQNTSQPLCGTVKTFPLTSVLSVVTERLITVSREGDNGIGQAYKILNHMTADNLMPHQLPRANNECKPWLIRWYPELQPTVACCGRLAEWIKKSPACLQEGIRMWVAELKMLFPGIKDEYEVGQIPRDDHVVKDPYDEFVEMRGTDEGIVLL